MVSFIVFCMRDNVNRTVALATLAARRLQSGGGIDSLEQTDDVQQQIMVEAGNVSVLFSAIFFFFCGVYIVSAGMHADLHVVQRSVLKKRIEYSMFVCLYVCFFSCLFNCMQFGPQDDLVLQHINARDDVILDIGRPIEWILTCPLMQLVIPIIGGEKVPDYRRWTMPLNAFVVLCFGFTAALQTYLPFKLAFYCSGVACFCVMLHQMNRTVVESTSGEENLFMGKSIIRNLSVIVALTWVPFPIWYALSPEGFNVIKNAAAMKIAVAFLNVFSKGAFIFYLNRVRADLAVREQAMNQLKMTTEGNDLEDGKAEGFLAMTLSKSTAAIIYEVLQSMGRNEDFEAVKEILEKHMITSSDDVMVLTPAYCNQINLPWGFVTTVKQKIRMQKVEMQDAWTLQGKDTSNGDVGKQYNVSVSRAPSEGGRSEPMSPTGRDMPLPPQVASDPRKLKEHAKRELAKMGRDPGEFEDLMGMIPRAGRERAELQAMLQQSQQVMLKEIRELRTDGAERARRTAEVEQKVEEDLANAHEVVGDMMEKVMDVLERRLQQHKDRNEKRGSILAQTSA
jgi:bacteriorhodopsin